MTLSNSRVLRTARRLTVAALLVLPAAVLAQGTAPASFYPVFRFVAQNSGKCIGVAGGSPSAGAEIIQWPCVDRPAGANQIFIPYAAPNERAFLMVALHSGMCLEVPNASRADGEALIQAVCDASKLNQRFRYQSYNDQTSNLIALHSGKCVDVRGPSVEDGAAIQQWSCAGFAQENQRFALKQEVLRDGTPLPPILGVRLTPLDAQRPSAVPPTNVTAPPPSPARSEVELNPPGPYMIVSRVPEFSTSFSSRQGGTVVKANTFVLSASPGRGAGADFVDWNNLQHHRDDQKFLFLSANDGTYRIAASVNDYLAPGPTADTLSTTKDSRLAERFILRGSLSALSIQRVSNKRYLTATRKVSQHSEGGSVYAALGFADGPQSQGNEYVGTWQLLKVHRMTNVAVPANREWVDAAIDVFPGELIQFAASGSWSNGGGNPQVVGANGFGNYRHPGTVLGTANLGALIGRVGDWVFAIGDGTRVIRCQTGGRFYFSMNDVPGTFGDNRGELVVAVQ